MADVGFQIERSILVIRGQRVMMSLDLAALYGVTAKRLHEQVRRNRHRFPDDFMFQLTVTERDELAAICGQFRNLKHSSVLPYAFSEHGAMMLANVLNSPRAIEMSVLVVRTFIKMREMLSSHKEIAQKFAELERKVSTHDEHIRALFAAIHELMTPPPSSRKAIGFKRRE